MPHNDDENNDYDYSKSTRSLLNNNRRPKKKPFLPAHFTKSISVRFYVVFLPDLSIVLLQHGPDSEHYACSQMSILPEKIVM